MPRPWMACSDRCNGGAAWWVIHLSRDRQDFNRWWFQKSGDHSPVTGWLEKKHPTNWCVLQPVWLIWYMAELLSVDMVQLIWYAVIYDGLKIHPTVGGWQWNFWIINSISFHFQTIRTIEMFWIRSFSPIRDCFLKKMEKENSGIFFCFEKWGVMIELQHKWFHDKENTLRFCQIRPPAGGMIQVRPGKKKKTHMGNPFWNWKKHVQITNFWGGSSR